MINTAALARPQLVREISEAVGSQSVIISIDVKSGLFGGPRCYGASARIKSAHGPVEWARQVADLGAGEILLTSVEREGTWSGFDLELTRAVTEAVSVPVIAHGGCGSLAEIGKVVHEGGASAVAVGSFVVYQKKGMGVLVNFPDEKELQAVLL